MVDIFQYLDYRKFLDKVIRERKKENPHFSHRYITQRLGLKSCGYILAVIRGKRKLTEKLILGLSDILKLNARESEYFMQLVKYNDAKTPSEKQSHFERLVKNRRRKCKQLASNKFRFYEKWYYSAIRELLSVIEFSGDFRELATLLTPSIAVSEAREAVEVLHALGMIEKWSSGVYRKKDVALSTGDAWDSAVVHALQRRFGWMGVEALDRFPRHRRDISNLTLSISGETFDRIKDRITQLRSEILEMAREDKSADRVVQCNFAVFPLSTPDGEKS